MPKTEPQTTDDAAATDVPTPPRRPPRPSGRGWASSSGPSPGR